MRYEHIELDLSTRACAALLDMVQNDMRTPNEPELLNIANNLAARLQRRDIDPHCPLNRAEDWLDT